MEGRLTPTDLQPESDAPDGGRPTFLEYAALGRRVGRRQDGRSALDLQSQVLRGKRFYRLYGDIFRGLDDEPFFKARAQGQLA